MISRRTFLQEVEDLHKAVDEFADEMFEKLVSKIFEKGVGGWDNDGWEIHQIIPDLKDHIKKGDPVDVANYAMFWNRRIKEENV